jgi:hypothetical protein
LRRHVRTFMVLGLVGVLAAGCASDKGPAEAALKAAEEAITATKGEAARYVPEQAKALEAALAAAKEKFGKGGNVPDAVTKATAMKPKAAEVLGILGMPVPDALEG